jgi:hypothetical protein
VDHVEASESEREAARKRVVGIAAERPQHHMPYAEELTFAWPGTESEERDVHQPRQCPGQVERVAVAAAPELDLFV